MPNNTYSKAYKEVLEIIKYFPKEEYNKIPKEKIDFYEQNMDKDYDFTIDPEVDLSQQNISKEANAIIVSLYQDYFATEEQKQKIKEILKLNEKKAEQERREKYNPDDIFKKEETNQSKSVFTLVEYKEDKWYKKLFSKLVKFFKR